MATAVAYYNRYNTRIAFQSSVEGVAGLTGAISTVLVTDLAASRVVVSTSGGKIASSPITTTILNFLSNVSSDIQGQLNAKQASLTTGNLTESTSSVLTITGGTGAIIGSGLTIQVKEAGSGQSGYLSAADWTTFSAKLSSALTSGYVLIGNGSNVATAVNTASVGDILASSSTGLTLKNSVILNANIASGAAITRSKLASGTAYRVVVNNASGVMTDNAAITASRALVSDSNGLPTHSSVTSTQLNYLVNTNGDIQDLLDNYIATQLVDSVVKSPGAGEDGYAITWDNANGQYTLIDPVTQGIPTAGTTNQVLAKLSNTDYHTDWVDLTLSFITDISASADDLNILQGLYTLGLTSTDLEYIIGLTSNIQDQVDAKMSNVLVRGGIFTGNTSNVAQQLAPGLNGQALVMVGSDPQWQTLTGTGTVTSVDVSGGSTGLTFSGGPISTTGTITMAGTLDANNGGTGFSSYTVGDILYANTTSTLAKLAATTDGYVLTLSGGVPVWAAGGGAGLVDGDYGDITVSGTGTAMSIDVDINKAWTGTHSFIDGNFSLLDNVDNTKILKFQLSGISAGTTRTLTIPDLSGTIALLGGSGNGAALTKTDDTNVTLTLGGGASTALLTAASLTLGWTGQLGVTRGGTGLSTISQGSIIYADALNSFVELPKNTTATRYISNTGTSNNPAWAQVDLSNGVTGVLPIGNGGTNSSAALTNGKVIISSAGALIEASTATYPSVTELSYVKGVTSAIQTQINNLNTITSALYFGANFDGQGGVVLVGTKLYFRMPKAGTITAWSIVAEGTSPTCTIDVWKVATGTALPTVSNTIMGTKPALSTGNAVRSTTFTGWTTTTFAANDIFCINIDACSAATKISFLFEVTWS